MSWFKKKIQAAQVQATPVRRTGKRPTCPQNLPTPSVESPKSSITQALISSFIIYPHLFPQSRAQGLKPLTDVPLYHSQLGQISTVHVQVTPDRACKNSTYAQKHHYFGAQVKDQRYWHPPKPPTATILSWPLQNKMAMHCTSSDHSSDSISFTYNHHTHQMTRCQFKKTETARAICYYQSPRTTTTSERSNTF